MKNSKTPKRETPINQLPKSSECRLTALKSYIKDLRGIHSTEQATEHSYRPSLMSLVNTLGGLTIEALNEPTRQECGAPDFVVFKSDVPIGYIECKDIAVNLDNVQEEDQLMRYRAALPNLILCNYLEFRWYQRGELREQARIGSELSQKISINSNELDNLISLFELFFNESAEPIRHPIDLAKKLASKTRLLRDCILEVLDLGTDTSLHKLLKAYRTVLIHDLKREAFADMQSQTITYGLFAARCHHQSDNFSREVAVFTETTPFLQEVFQNIAGPNIHPRIKWIVDDVVNLLKRANMEIILRNFGESKGKQDPVVHFYEDFLRAYDPELRRIRGAYYTPLPVVSYIVRSVDQILQDRFKLKGGLANTEFVEEDQSDSESKPSPRVMILDPAAGTGTFLCETVRTIKSNIQSQGLIGAWPDYVNSHLLPRLFGFELMMGPYAICHLKLALEISGLLVGASSSIENFEIGRLKVHLTDTLEKTEDRKTGLFAEQISNEAISSIKVKRDYPVMVIVGNPPWSVESSNEGRWIDRLLRGRDGDEQTSNYFEIDGKSLNERNCKLLNDIYVKFIRFAQWRVEKTGEGVIGFVTNNGWINNLTFRGMRKCLLDSFAEIHVLNLHGSARVRVHPDDENVFDIQQGSSIVLLTKFKTDANDQAKVYYAEIKGKRHSVQSEGNEGKYDYLNANDVKSTDWTKLNPCGPLFIFLPHDQTHQSEYDSGWRLDEIFLINKSGIKTHKDKFVYRESKEILKQIVNDFIECDPEKARYRYQLGEDRKDGWKVTAAQQDLQSVPNLESAITPILYRPFDVRFTYYTGKSGFIVRPRQDMMPHMRQGNNLGLIACRQKSQLDFPWNLVGVSRNMIDMCVLSSKTKESAYLFPLFLCSDDLLEERHANLNDKFIEELERCLDLNFIVDNPDNIRNSFCAVDVFNYIYAVLHSEIYRERYSSQLIYEFPKIQLPKSRCQFHSLGKLGNQLVSTHLMEREIDSELKPKFPVAGDGVVTKLEYVQESLSNSSNGRVWINDQQYFDDVTADVWEYRIGSYFPANKWLHNKLNKTLTFNEIEKYCQICAVLQTTIVLIRKVDEVIQSESDWI